MSRYTVRTCVAAFVFSAWFSIACQAQSLVPRAYLITPLHSNAITLACNFNEGSILFDPALPIEDSSGSLRIPVLSYYRSFGLFGRSANFVVSVPYAIADFKGKVLGSETNIHRSGLMNSLLRFSVNLKGAPAMELKEFLSWRQQTLLGASFTVMVPTGQYDPAKLINLGTNRWAFKPEIGVSHRWNNWILDAYGGVWFFTTNPEFFSENQYTSEINTLSQANVIATEMHISYDLKPGWWVSFDANYWYGGRTSVNGKPPGENSLQANSRLGGTGAIRIGKRQSLKLSYTTGAVIRVGGNYQILSVAWQYSWLDHRK